MNENKRGYWIYSIVAVIFGMLLFALLGYLIYDLILKLSVKDFSNNTVVQALITLIITVFIGQYYSKWIERRNTKKIELYKIQTQLSLSLIDLTSAFIWQPDNEDIKRALIRESSKVKLYFNDETLKQLNEFIKASDKKVFYDALIDTLKKKIK